MAKLAQSVIDELAKQGYPYPEISHLLLELQAGRSIVVFDDFNNVSRTLDPDQGWQFLSEWATNNNFSLSRRGSRRSQISALLDDIFNRQQLESEAASALNSLKAKARETTPHGANSAISDNLKNAEALQYQQLKDYQKRLFDPLTAIYYNSDLLKDITNTELRTRAATLLSANPHLAASYNPTHQTGGRLHLSHQTREIYRTLSRSIPELAPLFYTLYSDDSEIKTAKTLAAAQNKLAELYPLGTTNKVDINQLNQDISDYRHLINIGSTLTDISNIVNALPSSYLTQDRTGLDASIRRIIVRAAGGTHVTGNDLLAQLIRENQLSPDAALKLQFLAPRLELAEINLRTEIQNHPSRGRSRERWSANLAATIGVSPSVFWLKDQELDSAVQHFLKEYGVKSLDEAIAKELDGDKNIEKINSLYFLRDQSAQRTQYHKARSDNTIFFLQDQISKFGYNLQVIKEPYDKASRRFFSGLDKIDEIIHYPQRKLIDFWEELIDGRKKFLGLKTVIEFKNKSGKIIRIPLLNLPGFLLTQYNQLQLYLAEKVFKWSWGLSKQGGLFAPLKAIANYSFGFIQHEGDFRATNFYFGRKAMGNFLDWGAKRLKFESFVKMQKWAGEGLLNIGNKVTGGLLGKATAYLTSIGLSVEGIGIVLTAAMLAIDLIKGIGGFFKRFFNDSDFRDRFLNWAPAIGIFIGGLGTFLAGIPAAIAFGFSGLLSFIAGAAGGIAAFFLQGLIWAGATIIGVMLFYQIFNLSTYLDSASSLAQNIAISVLCEDNSNTPASRAACLAQYLNQCYGNGSITASNVSRGLSCLASYAIAPGAISEIRDSASDNAWLQCVGFVKAVAAWVGTSIGSHNACGYVNDPRFVSGLGGVKQGDAIVFKSSGTCSTSAPGHIGILKEDAGANICLIDANYRCSGCVTDGNCLPKTNVAGYLKL